MSRRPLTRKQYAFLGFLRDHVQEHKVWPTYREIVDHFDYRSPNSVTQNLQALARKGHLRRDRNGYHIVDKGSADGSIAVKSRLRSGQVEAADGQDRLSLASLFQGYTGLHALRLDEATSRTAALGEAQYVLVAEGDVPSGETAVVLHGGSLALGSVDAAGRVTVDGVEAATDAARVLGRYAGHAGPYGIVRAVLAAQGQSVSAEA